jgi:hypothetical protein
MIHYHPASAAQFLSTTNPHSPRPWQLNRLPQLLLLAQINTIDLVPLLHSLLEIHLVRLGEAAHQPREAQRQLVAAVDLTEMPGLAVEADDLLHGLGFQLVPFLRFASVRGWDGQDQHAGFDFELP